jgi:autotransporter-associated beta strand protein/predicted outer membrane repeat protein
MKRKDSKNWKLLFAVLTLLVGTSSFADTKYVNNEGDLLILFGNAAGKASSGDTVILAPDYIELTSTIFITNTATGITLVGNGGMISGENAHQIFNITSPAIDSIKNILLRNGSAGNGGAIYSAIPSNLKLIDSKFLTNNASINGGAIFIASDFLNGGEIVNSLFEGNIAGGDGGAIYVWQDFIPTDLGGTQFIGNKATGDGGAIYARGNITINAKSGDVTFSGNVAGSTPTPNAIFVENSYGGGLSLAAENGNTIYFYDPIESSGTNKNLTIKINENASDTGVVLFDTYQSNVYFEATNGAKISNGTMVLQNGAIFGANTNLGTFTVGGNATLAIVGSGGIKGGSVIFADGATIGTLAAGYNVNTVTLPNAKLGGILNVEIKNDGQNLTLGADLTDESASVNASLVKKGAGTLVLTGNNTYTGDTVINNGTIKGNIAANTNLSIAYGASYDGNSAGRTIKEISGSGNIINTTGITIQSGNFAGSINNTNTGGLTKDGTGTLVLTGTNTYTGDTVINNGTLKGNIANDTNLSIASGAIYDGYADKITIKDLSGAGDVKNTDGFIVQSGNFTGSMDSTNTGGLTKVGTGTLIFTGTNTYTGVTSIEGGTFKLTGSLASTEFVLHDGTTFETAFGSSPVTKKLDVSGNATYNGDLNAKNAELVFSDIKSSAVNDTKPLLLINSFAGIEGSEVFLKFVDNITLKEKDEIFLISATPFLTSSRVKSSSSITIGLVDYKFDLFADVKNLKAQVSSAKVSPASKTLSEGKIAGLGFLTQGQNLLVTDGINSLVNTNSGNIILGATSNTPGTGITNNVTFAHAGTLGSFGTIASSGLTYNSGSHVDVKGFNFLDGISLNKDIWGSSLNIGVFLESGFGSYKTYNDFVGYPSVHGKGESKYYGLGLILRSDYTTGLYWDASLRLGRSEYDYKTSDLNGQSADYESSGVYYGAHIGLGYQYKMDSGTIDLYGRILYNRQQKDSVQVLGQKVDFGSISSLRTRIGTRYTYNLKSNFGLYTGIAYEYEYKGTVNATVRGLGDIDSPSIKGPVGIGEIGFNHYGKKLETSIGLQGYIGKIEGIGGTLKIGYKF